MHVKIDDRRHHGLTAEIDSLSAGWWREIAGRTDLREFAVFDDEHGVLDRRALVTGYEPRAFEYDSSGGLYKR
jgi:hypothetical protein